MSSSTVNLDGILLGIGNPLLDISATVTKSFLDKYDLKPANAILADVEKHLPLYGEMILNYDVEYTAGGAAQNTIRAAQWMLQHKGASHYIGCVGDDEHGKNMQKAAEDSGVVTHYLKDTEKTTGTCAVLIQEKERSLVAYLGATQNYRKSHFDSKEIQEVVNKAKYYYTTGFFLTVSDETLEAAKDLGKHAKEHNKQFLLNLSAPFLINFFWEKVSQVLPYTDIIFCNEDEAATLGTKLEWGTDLQEIAKKLAEFPKENSSRKRMVIFTQGDKETIVYQDGKIQLFKPIVCTKEEIVDTNGAGDSFVGGFLSQYVQGRSLEDSVKGGHYCAWECIRRSGATYPEKSTFTL